MELDRDLLSRQEVRSLVEEAHKAQARLAEMFQEDIDRIVAAIAQAGERDAAELGRLAWEETGFGNAQDKAEKNRFAARQVYEAIRDQKTVGILRKDEARKVWDVGVPVGVIAGIVPSTNPTSTVIYKAMIALKAGNTIVFSPHPGAKRCTLETARRMAAAAEAAGCPKGAIGCITEPTMDAVEELMRHEHVRLILATGGAAMVRSAYSSGKPAIGVGAGNGPAYFHPSCDVKAAVAAVFRSKTFDNGTICASEQSILYHRDQAQQVEAELKNQGGVILSEAEAKKLASVLFRANGTMNPKIVGKPAGEIAALADLGQEARGARVLLARETGAGEKHPYSMEKLCPVLGLYQVESEDEALKLSCAILRHEGKGHTFALHAQDEAVVERFAKAVPVSRFLVNTPASMGGVGMTTGLFPAMTLGCGAVGGSSSSNNIGPMDLLNIRRVAWGYQQAAPGHTREETVDGALIDALTEKLLRRLMEQ